MIRVYLTLIVFFGFVCFVNGQPKQSQKKAVPQIIQVKSLIESEEVKFSNAVNYYEPHTYIVQLKRDQALDVTNIWENPPENLVDRQGTFDKFAAGYVIIFPNGEKIVSQYSQFMFTANKTGKYKIVVAPVYTFRFAIRIPKESRVKHKYQISFNLIDANATPADISLVQSKKWMLKEIDGQPPHEWAGVYRFSEENAPDAPSMSFTHKLTVKKSKNGLIAKIEGAGHHLNRNFNCTVKVLGNRLNVYFSGGKHGNCHKIANLKRGDLLLSLESQKANDETVIVTVWGKFKPIIGEPPTGKLYFKKT